MSNDAASEEIGDLLANCQSMLHALTYEANTTRQIDSKQNRILGELAEIRGLIRDLSGPPKDQSAYLSRKQAAKYLGVSVSTFDRHRERLNLKKICRPGAASVYERAEIDEAMRQHAT